MIWDSPYMNPYNFSRAIGQCYGLFVNMDSIWFEYIKTCDQISFKILLKKLEDKGFKMKMYMKSCLPFSNDYFLIFTFAFETFITCFGIPKFLISRDKAIPMVGLCNALIFKTWFKIYHVSPMGQVIWKKNKKHYVIYQFN